MGCESTRFMDRWGAGSQTKQLVHQTPVRCASTLCCVPGLSVCLSISVHCQPLLHAVAACSESEHQVRLSKFSGAVAISSSDYFGSSDGSGGGSGLGSRRSTSTRSGDLDSASRLVSQLSLKASSELLQMAGSASQAVGSVTHKLSGMATKFMSDLGRGY